GRLDRVARAHGKAVQAAEVLVAPGAVRRGAARLVRALVLFGVRGGGRVTQAPLARGGSRPEAFGRKRRAPQADQDELGSHVGDLVAFRADVALSLKSRVGG